MRKVFTLVILLISVYNFSYAVPVNYVTNGNFETGTQGWFPFNNNGSQTFALDANSPIVGSNSAKITITNGTSNGAISENWRLGARWRMSTFKSGRYLVHFKARASRNLQLVSIFQQNFSPYSSWGYVEWNLTTTVQDFDVVLENTNGDVGGYWAFVLYYGHLSTGDQVWIDDVKIEELVSSTSGVLTNGNICNGDFETNTANFQGNVQGWKTFNTSPANLTYGLETTNPISGLTSLKVTSVSAGTAGWHSQLIWNFCPVLGLKYSIEFKAKATVPFIMSAEIIDDWNSGIRDNPLGFADFNITTNTQSFSFDYPNLITQYDLYTAIFWLGNLPAGQTVFVDDVKIYQKASGISTELALYDDATTKIKIQKGQLLINTQKEAFVNIYNLNGTILMSRPIRNGQSLFNPEKGIYIVQIVMSNRIIKSEKIIIN